MQKSSTMKLLQAVSLLVFLPTLALAQATPPVDDTTKEKPIEPVLEKDHSGPGRIGVRLAFDKTTGLPSIAAMTRGGAAADFGFQVGDVILKIDRNYTRTLTEDEVRLALHGDPGTAVELTIQRDDNPKLIVRSLERRIPAANSISEDMPNPPMSGVAIPVPPPPINP